MAQELAFSKTIEKIGAFKIDREILDRIYRLATDFLGEAPKCSAEIEGDEFASNDLDSLLDDPIVQSRRITNISIGRYVSDKRFDVTFSNNLFCPVRIVVSGDRNSGMVLRDGLVSLVNAKKQWYSFFAVAFAQPILNGIMLLLVMQTLVRVLAWALSPLKINEYFGTEWASGVTVLSITAAIITLLYLVRFWLFPSMVFDIGKSAAIGKRIEIIRERLFIVFGLGVVVAVLGEIIARKLHGE
jgi:hypothetical protein